jgi:hypothetical protein
MNEKKEKRTYRLLLMTSKHAKWGCFGDGFDRKPKIGEMF